MRLFLMNCLSTIVGSIALCAADVCVAEIECVQVSQRGRSVTSVDISNRCAEPVTVTFFTNRGTEVVNVPSQETRFLTMSRFQRWRACHGVSNVFC